MYKPTPIATGIDISDRQCKVVTVDESNEVAEEATIKTTPAAVKRYFGGREQMNLVLEVGPHCRWMAELLIELGHEVLVCNARKVRAIYENENKADDIDAELMARLRRADPNLLFPVNVLARPLNHLAIPRSRDRLVQARSKLINCVRGTVKSTGQRMPRCDADHFHLRVDELPYGLRTALLPVMTAIGALTGQIKELDHRVDDLCRYVYPETERLRQVPGVGPITALAFVLTIADPHRFPTGRHLVSYLGLRPRRDQSGDSDPRRGITKCGDRYVRRLLVGSAQHILGPFGKQSALRDWGVKLFLRGGKAPRKQAAVAMARKLAVLLHRLWVTGDDYLPYPQGEPGPLVLLPARR
jgi:transposase